MPFDHLPLMDDNQVACVDMASGKSEAFVYWRRGDGQSPMNASLRPADMCLLPVAVFPLQPL